MNSRQRINRRRSQIAVASLVLILCLGCVIGWVIAMEMTGASPLMILGVVSLGVLQRLDVCPSCGRNISLLPNGGFLSWPHLSNVKCCPFCGDGFSSNAARKDDETLA